MTAAAFAWTHAQAGSRKRPTRERILRPIKPLSSEVVAYSRAMRALLAEVRTATEGSILTYLRQSEGALDSAEVSDDFVDFLRAVLAALRRSWSDLAAQRAIVMARSFTARTNRRHQERFHESVREVLGVNLAGIVSEQRLGKVLRLKTEENVALIKSIPEEYLDRVERAVYQHVIHGQPGTKSLAKKLREIGEISEKRAKFIARDQTAKLVSALNRERNIAIGIEAYKWRTSKDERVRPTHRSKEGKTFRWDDPPETGHPGEDFNCVPGSAVIDLADGCHKLWRRFYSGPLVAVVASDGRRLEATPNHPVLTTRGWLPIDQLQEGDDLVHCELDRRAIGEVHESRLQVRFEDLFEAAAIAELPHTARGSESDFHGDGSEDDVDVVGLERLLVDDRMATLRQGGSDLDLAGSDPAVAAARLDPLRPGQRCLSEVLATDSTDSLMSRLRESRTLDGRHAAHADEIGCTSVPSPNQVLREDSSDSTASDRVTARESQNAQPGLVEPHDLSLREVVASIIRISALGEVDLKEWIPGADCLGEAIRAASEQDCRFAQLGPVRYQLLRVVEKTVSEYSGHVYNLSNDRQWYTANGLIVHNCRCTASPILKF